MEFSITTRVPCTDHMVREILAFACYFYQQPTHCQSLLHGLVQPFRGMSRRYYGYRAPNDNSVHYRARSIHPSVMYPLGQVCGEAGRGETDPGLGGTRAGSGWDGVGEVQPDLR